jgi:hypothetical protein
MAMSGPRFPGTADLVPVTGKFEGRDADSLSFLDVLVIFDAIPDGGEFANYGAVMSFSACFQPDVISGSDADLRELGFAHELLLIFLVFSNYIVSNNIIHYSQ